MCSTNSKHTFSHVLCCLDFWSTVMYQSLPRACFKKKTSSVIHGSWPRSHPLIHSSAELNNTALIKCALWYSHEYPWLPEPAVPDSKWAKHCAQDGLARGEEWQSRQMKLVGRVVLMYLEPFIFVPSVYRCLLWHFSIKGFASVVLGNNAQLTMRGIPPMVGCLLIKWFYVT